MIVLEILIFGYVVWLGLYLIQRDVQNTLLRYAGLGLLVYGLMLAVDILQKPAPDDTLLMRFGWPLPLWLSAFWFLATLELVPPETGFHFNARFFLIGAAVLYLAAAVTDFVFNYADESPQWGYMIFLMAVVIPLGYSFLAVIRSRNRPFQIVGLATLFMGLGVAALLLALDVLPSNVVLVAISMDLVAFGVAIAFWDAAQQGEALWLDMLRAFDAAFFIALLFGGQVALAMILSGERGLAFYVLLLTTISAAIFIQVFSDSLQKWFDQVAFSGTPQLQQAREELRTAARALPRVKSSVDFAEMDEDEFVRLTRRALSNMGNLPRLAASPLIYLPIIEARLIERGAEADTLERAAELKAILTESIERLKPRGKEDFGTTDEWRYYNATYFPYVAGIKPYSRRADSSYLEPRIKAALEWFQSQVPERTLYNWQNAATQLIAQDLRERLK